MRSFAQGCVALGLVAAVAGSAVVVSTGCGGSKNGSGGATSSTTTTTSKSTTVGVTTSTSAATTSSGPMNCTEVTLTTFQRDQYNPDPMAQFEDIQFVPSMLGAATPDAGDIQFYDFTVTGALDLASSDNNNFSTCTTCLLVNQDVDPNNGPSKTFFQTSGTIDIGTTTFPAVSGTIKDATLVEVTIDPSTFTSTPVAGGACIHITSAPFTFPVAPAGWTCDPGGYGDNFQCDCNACGVVDPDCMVTPALAQQVNGCGPGQTCNADGKTCAGNITGWTCPVAKYNENHNVPAAMQTGTCDCNCGIPDLDCTNTTAAVVGCTASAPTCNANGFCLPTAWTCDPSFYGDKDQVGGGCDCGCGVVDVDCADATKASCLSCDDPSGTGFAGSCDTAMCTDAASKINATNNAICNP